MTLQSEETSRSPAKNTAIWLNTIDRAIIESGQLQELIDAGVTGVTSVPIAFAHTVQYRSDYNELVHQLDGEGRSPREIMEAVIADDVQRTADFLHPIYENTNGADGYAGLAIDPRQQNSSAEIQAEGLRLAYEVDRANVMVQVPATPDGIEAMKNLIADGISVNSTHVYTPETYTAVTQAYLAGIQKFLQTLDIWRIAPTAVVSVPLQPLNNVVDEMLEGRSDPLSQHLRGKTAAAVAREIYGRFRDTFQGADWEALADEGAHVPRPLWANSSTPVYPATIRSLSPYRLNTYLAHRPTAQEPPDDRAAAQKQLASLSEAGIDLAVLEQIRQSKALESLLAGFARLEEDVLVKRDQLALA